MQEITKNNQKVGRITTLASAVASKIRIKDSSQTDLFNMLTKVYLLQGINKNNRPDDLETKVLIEFIKKNLGRFAPNEFLTAFELAAAKEIQVDWHYQTFSCNYVGTVMKAYEEQYRPKVVEHMNKIQSGKIESKPPSQEERKKLRKAFIETCILKPIKQNNTISKHIFPCSIKKVYDYFYQAGLIELDQTQRKVIRVFCENKYRKELKNILDTPAASPQQHQLKKSIKSLLEPENAKQFENNLQDYCRIHVIELILKSNTIEQIEQKLMK